MADVNNVASDEGNCNDYIGLVWIEGLTNTGLHHSFKQSTKHFPSVYLGETIRYEIIVKKPVVTKLDSDKVGHSQDAVWKKRVCQLTSQALLVPVSAHASCLVDRQMSTALRSPSEGNSQKSSNDNSVILGMTAQRKAMGNVMAAVATQATTTIKEQPEASAGLACPILATFLGNIIAGSSKAFDEGNDGSGKPYFRDEDTYVIPMSFSIQNTLADCRFVTLQSILWLYTVSITRSSTSPELTDPTDWSLSREPDSRSSVECPGSLKLMVKDPLYHESDHEENMTESSSSVNPDLSPVHVSSSQSCVQEKSVSVQLKLQCPPELKIRHSCAGRRQLIFLSVSNHTQTQMVIKNIQVLSSSSQLPDIVQEDSEGSSGKWEPCPHMMTLESPRRHSAFPVILSFCEELNLIYRLHISPVLLESELSVRANVKWTHAGASSEITSVYKLPRIKIRCPPFVIGIKCEDKTEICQSFSVTYTISNQLHDFMSMRLYYHLDNLSRLLSEQGGTEEEVQNVLRLKDSIVCHDPDTTVSSCLRGTSLPLRVSFHIHKPGVYEMSELMKVNLRYSLQDSQISPSIDDRDSQSTSSDTSTSLPSSEDHLSISAELWRGRAGSTTSLSSLLTVQSAEDRRRSFASKSYSFGDLGPAGSTESDEVAGHTRTKPLKRSSAVRPPLPVPSRMASQTEQDLIRPSNFLKLPLYIYIRDPLLM